MHKLLIVSLVVNLLQLLAWTPHFHATSNSFLALTLNLLQLVVLVPVLTAVYRLYRKDPCCLSFDKFVRKTVNTHPCSCLCLGWSWTLVSIASIILLLTRFQTQLTETVYLLSVSSAMLICCSSWCEMFAVESERNYRVMRIGYFCMFLVVTICSGVLVGKVSGLEALVESQWLVNYLAVLQIIQSETLFYILMVPFTAFLLIGCWLFCSCLTVNFISAQVVAAVLLVSLIIWMGLFIHRIYTKLRYGQTIRHNSNITQDKITIEKQLQGRSVMLIESVQGHCAICLVGYEAKEKVVTLKCDHRFHYQCVQEWFERKPECPICRVHVLEEKREQL